MFAEGVIEWFSNLFHFVVKVKYEIYVTVFCKVIYSFIYNSYILLNKIYSLISGYI